MDLELKAYLESLRHDLMAHAEQMNRSTRQDLTQQMDGMRQALMTHAEELNQDTRRDLMAHAEQLNGATRQHTEQLNRETRILVEDLRDQIQLVAEGLATVSDKLERFHDEMEAQIFGLDKRVMRLEAQQRSSGSDA